MRLETTKLTVYESAYAESVNCLLLSVGHSHDSRHFMTYVTQIYLRQLSIIATHY